MFQNLSRKRRLSSTATASEPSVDPSSSNAAFLTTTTGNVKKNYRGKQRTATSSPSSKLKEAEPDLAPILSGVIVCLSGFAQEEKEAYHSLVEELGGVYTRDLDVTRNTHLVTRHAEGAKYEAARDASAAADHHHDNDNHNDPIHVLHIVKASWLDACRATKTRVMEALHGFCLQEEGEQEGHDNDQEERIMNHDTSSTLETKQVLTSNSFRDALHDVLLSSNKYSDSNSRYTNDDGHENERRIKEDNTHEPIFSTVFSSCHFFLVGFEDETENESETAASSKGNLARLIRRGLGTVLWDFDPTVCTHVIINDDENESFSNEDLLQHVKQIQMHYPDGPAFVSPWWVLDSWKLNELQDSYSYPPVYHKQTGKNKKAFGSNDEAIQKKKKKSKMTSTTNALFRGYYFVLVRVTPPSWAVDFSSSELEQSLRDCGGKPLSSKIIEALKADTKHSTTTAAAAFNRRTCFVIGWGSYNPKYLDTHPLLGQVKRNNLCDLEEVTPIWLQTCIAEETILKPSKSKPMFVPSRYGPMHSLVVASSSTSKLPLKSQTTKSLPFKQKEQNCSTKDDIDSAVNSNIRISVTGFDGWKRTAIVHFIQAIGAKYDDSLRLSTTSHLICRSAAGPKYEKARQWNIPTVTEEWLYHIAQQGLSTSLLLPQKGEKVLDSSTSCIQPQFLVQSSSSSQ